MSKMIKILGGIGVLLVAIVVAAVAILSTMDFNEYRSLIAEKVKEATGRDLIIAGDLGLNISLSPSISVNGVTFGNAEWGSAPHMVSLDTFAAEVDLMPLLSGDVQVKRVVLKGVKVLLETNAEGTPNWLFDQVETKSYSPSSGESEESGDGALPVVHTLQVRDVTLVYKDGVTGVTQTLSLPVFDLSSDGASSPMRLLVEAVVNNETIKLSGDLGSTDILSDNRMFPVKLDIDALGATIVLDGTISNPREGKGMNMGFSVKADNLAALAGRAMVMAGIDDKAPVPASPFSIEGALRDGDDVFSIDGLALKIGGSDLSGNMAINLSGSVPTIIADLSSNHFDLADVIAQSEESSSQSSLGSSTGSVSAASDDGRVFPNDPLVLGGMKAVNAEISFVGKTILAQGVTLSDVNVGVMLKGGRLAISPLGATFADGRIGGDIKIDGSTSTTKLDIKITATQIDYGKLYKANTGDEMIKGKADLDIDMKGAGASVRALMASLNGKLRVKTENGFIDSGALSFVTGPLTALFEGEESNTLRCAVVDFDIVNGLATSKATIFETGGLSIIGEGQVDLRNEKLDLKFDPRAKNVSLVSAAEIGILVTGTIKEPSISPDMGDVAMGVASTAASIATGGLSTLLGMVVEGVTDAADETDYCALALAGKPLKADQPKQQETTAGTETTTEKKAEEPKDISIGDALNSLFGN